MVQSINPRTLFPHMYTLQTVPLPALFIFLVRRVGSTASITKNGRYHGAIHQSWVAMSLHVERQGVKPRVSGLLKHEMVPLPSLVELFGP